MNCTAHISLNITRPLWLQGPDKQGRQSAGKVCGPNCCGGSGSVVTSWQQLYGKETETKLYVSSSDHQMMWS